MEAFFASYPDFVVNHSAPFYVSFAALATQRGWSEHGKHYRRARARFREALVLEFNTRFGTDDTSLASWQTLCAVLAASPGGVPESITQCRKVLKRTHVNLVDLVQAKAPGEVRIFRNYKELVQYTKETGNYFPKKDAKAGGLLKALLREIP